MKQENYNSLIAEIKQKISDAQLKTVVAANSQMLLLYWQMGNYILANQTQQGWGSKVIDLLSADLKREFPKLKGFSVRNLKYMKSFASTYTAPIIHKMIALEVEFKQQTLIAQQLVAQLEFTNIQTYIIVQQSVAQIEEADFLQSILSRITWSHHIILIDKESNLGKRF